jgi:N-acetylglutamate synthase-like GNAT family acetyltransferase
MIRYSQITVHDPLYEQEKKLRTRMLRAPLGLALTEHDLRGEDEQIHIVALDDDHQVKGCLLVAFSHDRARIRQLAVDDALQGKGVGRKLMLLAEQAVKERGVSTVMLHGRLTARGFFEKLGYHAVSDVFIEVAIPHIALEKTFGPKR